MLRGGGVVKRDRVIMSDSCVPCEVSSISGLELLEELVVSRQEECI